MIIRDWLDARLAAARREGYQAGYRAGWRQGVADGMRAAVRLGRDTAAELDAARKAGRI